ncbi:hypothetical protein EDC04DRAFT_2610724 [Pisolithus marmoratus]|nr:hypothetical protein EDC04DRAFT_2610724 [Pisolithus marmoratus]
MTLGIGMLNTMQGHAEWRLGKFLAENLTQAQINTFLKLDWLNSQKPLFSSACKLLDWMDSLLSGPRWKVMELEVDGYNMEKKIELIYQGGLEVVESLWKPNLCSKYVLRPPSCVEECRIAGSNMCPGWSFLVTFCLFYKLISIKDTLPEGATLVPIITTSDKTPVTRHTGSLEMHPLFLTTANIDSDICMKAIAYAWHCVAFMLTIKFDVHPDYQTILQAQLWHRCVNIVTEKLKHTANVGKFMIDPFGDVWHCFMPLVAWTADLPEQQLITSVSRNTSPVTLATLQQFGDSTHQPPCMKNCTLNLIHVISGDVEPWMLDLAKANQLLGIHLLGARKLLELTNSMLITKSITNVIHALINFIYLTQRHVHTESSIRDMEALLVEFHATKHNILDAGDHSGKDNFNIPKLELMLSFADAIRRSGGQSNFTEQIIHLLDHEEHIHLLDIYLLLCEHDEPLVNATKDEENLLCSADPTSTWISHVAPGEQCHFNSPQSICNLFTKGLMSSGATAVLSVTITPNCSKLKIADIGNVYALPDLALMLNEYVAHHVESTTFNSTLQMFDEITVWYKFCIQQYSTCRLFVIMPSQVVQAQPLSFDFPLGNCDAVLLNVDGQSQANPGFHVAEVWAVFQLICSCHSQDLLPDFLSQPLLYIQPFHVITTPDSQLDTCLWILERIWYLLSGRRWTP